MKKRLFLVGNGEKECISHLAETLLRVLESRPEAEVVGADLTCLRDLSRLEADLVMVLGGDGTILGAVHRMGNNPLPILGIHMGQLGFLTAYLDGQMTKAVEMALTDRLRQEPRLMAHVSVRPRPGEPPRWRARAVNDAVLGRPRGRGIMTVDVHLGGTFVGAYTGDGVIVSTPGGSTAYCLSSGGPILVPDMDSFIIVPLACHTLALRPLVIHADQGVELSIGRESRCGSATLVVDGQLSTEVENGELVTVEAAPEKLHLLVDPDFNFFQSLREKFGWTGQPRYRR